MFVKKSLLIALSLSTLALSGGCISSGNLISSIPSSIAAGGITSDDNDNQIDNPYVYSGSCTTKFKVGRGSSLAPEVKKNDMACVEYSPKAYQGAGATGATVIVVSATWCEPCKQFKTEFPDLLDIAEKHKATVKVFVDSATQSEIDHYGPEEFFVSQDLDAIEKKYGVISYFPKIFVIDKNGQLVQETQQNLQKIDQVLSGL